MPKPLKKIEWQALEYEFYKKKPDWFWAVGIVTIALFVSALLLNNLLFGLLAMLGGFSIALYGAKKPPSATFSIEPNGIKINDRIYEYENLKSFWLNYNPPYKKELLIESKKTFMPHIIIPLGDADPIKIRAQLLQLIKEEKIEESLMETIAKILKF